MLPENHLSDSAGCLAVPQRGTRRATLLPESLSNHVGEIVEVAIEQPVCPVREGDRTLRFLASG